MTCDKCDESGKVNGFNCARCVGTGGAMVGVSYAGIGSRETPLSVMTEMENIAMQLALRGWVLRSGAAKGADTAFERGCKAVAGRKAVRVATGLPSALAHASMFHPAWSACSDHAKALHARNSLIMLGDWLDDPARFVVCWTADGAVAGGTGQALRIAAAYGVPVFNLATTPVASLWSWLDGK